MAFPSGGVDNFGTVTDLVDKVMAAHVNALRTAVSNLQTVIGTSALTSDWTLTGSASTSTTSWTTLSDRITNLEKSLLNGISGTSTYFKKSGDTITAVSSVALTAKSDGTNNIIESKTSANVLGFYVDKTGIPYVNVSGTGKAVMYKDSTDYNSIWSTLNDLGAGVLGNAPINVLMLAGM